MLLPDEALESLLNWPETAVTKPIPIVSADETNVWTAEQREELETRLTEAAVKHVWNPDLQCWGVDYGEGIIWEHKGIYKPIPGSRMKRLALLFRRKKRKAVYGY